MARRAMPHCWPRLCLCQGQVMKKWQWVLQLSNSQARRRDKGCCSCLTVRQGGVINGAANMMTTYSSIILSSGLPSRDRHHASCLKHTPVN